MPKDETRHTTKAAIDRGKPARFDHHTERNIKKDIKRGQTTIMAGNCRFMSDSEKLFHVRMIFYDFDKLLGAVIIAFFKDDQQPLAQQISHVRIFFAEGS